ncbi:hypothetical protein EYF80_000333 [Liparis tanakae]|uniref:Uncharacterized protein n=1 Tax=Liparis tanakae TaxID=230148 RepID=A0A4Z2JHS0_9TELE|nr:hypothetical protein EYF80_000333 [Liparis tanakae]
MSFISSQMHCRPSFSHSTVFRRSRSVTPFSLSLSSGKRSQSNIFGQGKPNADITGAQPSLTLSHRDRHGWMGSSRSSRHTGAKREQRNFLVSGWHCFWTSGIQDEACCRTSFMVSCPSRFGRRISVYSMSLHRRRFAGIALQLFFL